MDKKWYLMDDPSFSYAFATTQLIENKAIQATAEENKNISIDKDSDVLSDEKEIKFGTDPGKSDTDRDGYTSSSYLLLISPISGRVNIS